MMIKKELFPSDIFWFPGRWVGGISLITGPLLLLAGGLLRLPFDFFFTNQLIAFQQAPLRMQTAYNLFLAGNILLWPAIATLATLIGQTKPGWAFWGGSFVMLGLFARTFHYGINHFAFQLVVVQNLEQATKAVADSYGAFHIVATLSAAILFGWVILAVGAYLSKNLGLARSISLALMSSLMIGVLKGSSAMSIVALLGLCIALVPLGVDVLHSGPRPGLLEILKWSVIIVLLIAVMYFLGQAG